MNTAADVAMAHWSASGPWKRLPGENYNLLGSAGVLKIAAIEFEQILLEQTMTEMYCNAGLPVANLMGTTQGERAVSCELFGKPAVARLFECLPGTPWRECTSSDRLLGGIGDMLARLHEATVGDVPEFAFRTHQWDVAEAGQHRVSIPLIHDDVARRSADQALHDHAGIDLTSCPRGLLHGDFHDENILVQGDTITGVVDLGDALVGAYVQDLAITLSYALQQIGVDPVRAAVIVSAYDARRALTPDEQRVLPALIGARHATSLCIAAARFGSNPEHATWFSHMEPTLRAIQMVQAYSPRDLEDALCQGCQRRRQRGRCVDDLRAKRQRLGPSLSLSYDDPLHIVEGRGQYLLAADGRVYLDLVNNVCHVGHCNARVVEAIATQAATLNTNTRYLHETVLEYADRLTATMPAPLDTCFFVNSGSEANELALRLARAATEHTDVVVIDGAYHGSTGNCIAMSPYKFNGPGGRGQADWVHSAPMPDVYRGEIRDADAGLGYALEVGRVIGEAASKGRSIAGFFAETLLSCGGQIPLPSGYLAGAFEHVRAAGGLCIADEVQVGLGRVGDAMWGFERQGVVPDIVVLGKPMGNGHPIGAVVTTRAIAEAFANGMEFFSTFGGNPVSASAGLAVLDVVEEDGLQSRATRLGDRFMDGLRALQSRYSIIGDVRGRGLFLGVELVRDRTTLEPAATEATMLVNNMKARGILLSTDGPLHNVIKIKPPLVLNEDDVDRSLRALDEVLGLICED